MSNPSALIKSRTKPILPILVCICERIEKNKPKKLIAHKIKAMFISHPNLPMAYSLIIRHELSNSGFSKCNKVRRIINTMIADNEILAHRGEISDAGFAG